MGAKLDDPVGIGGVGELGVGDGAEVDHDRAVGVGSSAVDRGINRGGVYSRPEVLGTVAVGNVCHGGSGAAEAEQNPLVLTVAVEIEAAVGGDAIAHQDVGGWGLTIGKEVDRVFQSIGGLHGERVGGGDEGSGFAFEVL